MTELLTQISDDYPGICFIEGQRNGKYPYSHSMLIEDTLIDTGISSGFLRKLKREANINTVLLTHWHEDHISGNRLFPNATFMAHSEDIPIIQDVSKMYEFYDVADDPAQEELFDTILQGLRMKDVRVDGNLSDNYTIKIGESYALQTIYTPGHTKGHCCFYEKNSHILFLADIDLSSLGPWYGGIDSDVDEFEQSIQKVMALNADIAISGHKGIIYGSQTIKNQLGEYLDIIHKRDNKIMEMLSEKTSQTIEELIGRNIVYPRYTQYKLYEILAERIMIQSHMKRLLKKNRIISTQNYNY
ncbi:MAG: Hydroxyacylglutathione hydrolase [Promethearchaeota archaeon]|nr:MAG: Hydroxyacylglutathione hydrolase [Candidatus Lokiarchaeota archaeon]